MDTIMLLLANGFFLSFILLVLLIMLSSQLRSKKPDKIKIKADLKKIKEQIEED